MFCSPHHCADIPARNAQSLPIWKLSFLFLPCRAPTMFSLIFKQSHLHCFRKPECFWCYVMYYTLKFSWKIAVAHYYVRVSPKNNRMSEKADHGFGGESN